MKGVNMKERQLPFGFLERVEVGSKRKGKGGGLVLETKNIFGETCKILVLSSCFGDRETQFMPKEKTTECENCKYSISLIEALRVGKKLWKYSPYRHEFSKPVMGLCLWHSWPKILQLPDGDLKRCWLINKPPENENL